VFVSQRNLDVAKRQLCLPLDNGVVVHNPPRMTEWSLIPFPEGPMLKMAMVARLECGVKGQALVLQVLAEPVWADRDWQLEIYGKGPDEAYLKELIVFLGLEGRVRLCGHVADIREAWAKNMLLVMASSGEGKPLALTESLLCGRPAVVTDVAGNAELVQHLVHGFVAESATLQSLSRALGEAWAHRHELPAMGLRAHADMMQKLSPPPESILAAMIAETGVGSA
jgi:glycosyltransferase involved in cell wall biosynthesis